MKVIFISFLVLFLLTSEWLFAQEKTCNCRGTFDDLTVKLEFNYIKYHQLSFWANPSEYEDRKNRFKQISANTSLENCAHILQDFLSYFDDGHLFVFERPAFSEVEIEKHKKEIKAKKIPLEKLRAKLKQKSDSELAGEWIFDSMAVGIIEEENQFHGYILKHQNKSLTGELIIVLNPGASSYYGTYYSNSYQPRYVEGEIYKDGGYLTLTGGMLWKRKSLSEETGNKPFIRQVENAVVLTIPSFLVDYDELKKFLGENAKTLNETEFLIIDIRGNTGGNAIYFPLISLFATNDVPASQGQVVSSPDNIEYFKKQAAFSAEIYNPLLERMSKNPGKIVDGPAYKEIKMEKKENKIKNVAILTDRGNKSAAESFIIHAKGASEKVETFGSPTGGVIDYTSTNGLALCSGNQKIYFGYPTSTLNKEIPNRGFNKTGIKPDVPIRKDVQNKIRFIVEYYKR